MCLHGSRRYLPDLPILTIFDALPLSKLLKTGRVCPRFAGLQAEALSKRKTLTLFLGSSTREQLYTSELFFEPHLDQNTTRAAEEAEAEYSAIEVKDLDEDSVNWLMNTFPRVTHLRLILGEKIELDQIIQLLEYWSDKLVKLGIWFPDYSKYISKEYLVENRPLLDCINEHLLSLQYLIIDVPHYYDSWIVEKEIDLSVIGRLKFFASNIRSLRLFASLTRYGIHNENLQEIRLLGSGALERTQLLKLPHELASKFTALNVRFTDGTERLKPFFGIFNGLKYLSLSEHDSDIRNILVSLAPLAQSLTFLSLDASNGIIFQKAVFLLESLPQFASLETLKLSEYTPKDFPDTFQLDQLFPRLKWIFVNYYETSSNYACYNHSNTMEEILLDVRQYLERSICRFMARYRHLKVNAQFTVYTVFDQAEPDPGYLCIEGYGYWREDRWKITDYKLTYTDQFKFTEANELDDWQYETGKEVLTRTSHYYQ